LGDAGVRAHTNFRLLQPNHPFSPAAIRPNSGPPYPGYLYETPASIACVYGLVLPLTPYCDPNVVTANPTGGSRAIAIVDAYDYPSAASDLSTFSSQFGLPAANFSVVYATGTQPPQDPTGGWELEEALDIEWAHAMAPNATLYLVEANSNSFTDLLVAESVATSLVTAAGGGEVSNSWVRVSSMVRPITIPISPRLESCTCSPPGTVCWPSTRRFPPTW
jgi:subtilase family serine protease